MQDYSIIKEKAFQEIEKALSSSELVDLRVKYLGKTGEISLLMKNMKDIAPEERASFGKIVNELKTEVETKIQQKDAFSKKRQSVFFVYLYENKLPTPQVIDETILRMIYCY